MPLDLLVARGRVDAPVWPIVVSLGVGACLFATLVAIGPHGDRRWSAAVFGGNSAAVAVRFAVRDPHYATQLASWVPFQGTKLACIVVAVLAPAIASGSAALAIPTAGAFAVRAVLRPAAASAAAGEPWPALAFALTAAICVVHRVQRGR